MDFEHSTFLITGASQGLGRALALHFAGRGARVLLAARSEAGLKETADQVLAAGGQCDWQVCDLAERASVERLAAHLSEQGETVDVLLNNAADTTSKPLLETALDEIESIVGTNVVGTTQLTKLIVSGMLERGRGMVINVSSLAGYKPNPRQTVYGISKAAVNGFSEALEVELRGTPIHVMNVALSSVGGGPNQMPVEHYVQRLERAIIRREHEVFLSMLTKWLMRLYRFFPPLARLR